LLKIFFRPMFQRNSKKNVIRIINIYFYINF
jgi:hypothetical protein